MNKSLIFTLFFLVSSSASATFVDTSGHKYEDAILFVQSRGVVEGYADGSYKPDALVNRAEFVKILIEAANVNTALLCRIASFPDVPGDTWYFSYVQAARCASIIGGYPDGTFKPASNVNFAEAAKIVSNVFNLPIDESGISSVWWQPFVNALDRVNAVPAPRPHAEDLLTRGQMAEIIYRLLSDDSSVKKACVKNGCNGELCVEQGQDAYSPCVWDNKFTCYEDNLCERQPNGECGWTMTTELQECLEVRADQHDFPIVEYKDFTSNVLERSEALVLFFYAEWCPYCVSHDDYLEKLFQDESLGYPVYKVNYDENTDLRERFVVINQDTFVFVHANGTKGKVLTFPTDNQIRDLLIP